MRHAISKQVIWRAKKKKKSTFVANIYGISLRIIVTKFTKMGTRSKNVDRLKKNGLIDYTKTA